MIKSISSLALIVILFVSCNRTQEKKSVTIENQNEIEVKKIEETISKIDSNVKELDNLLKDLD